MKDPAFLFYPQDFLVGTMTMTFEDRGKYITLLSVMHQQGKLSEETIRFLVGSISDSLRLKFKCDENGLFYNERLLLEIEKRSRFIESRTNNGKLGGRPKKEETYIKPKGKAKKNHSVNENVNENIDDFEMDQNGKFEFFWNEYDKKVGDKEKIKAKFFKISDIEQAEIFKHIPKYKESQPDKKYRKNPETYLNNKSWNDEIITNEKIRRTNGFNSPETSATIAETERIFAEYGQGNAYTHSDRD